MYALAHRKNLALLLDHCVHVVDTFACEKGLKLCYNLDKILCSFFQQAYYKAMVFNAFSRSLFFSTGQLESCGLGEVLKSLLFLYDL